MSNHREEAMPGLHEHDEFTLELWKDDVAGDETLLGYGEWVGEKCKARGETLDSSRSAPTKAALQAIASALRCAHAHEIVKALAVICFELDGDEAGAGLTRAYVALERAETLSHPIGAFQASLRMVADAMAVSAPTRPKTARKRGRS